MIFVETKSWEEIEQFFAKLTLADEYFRPMLELISTIKNSTYAIGLYTATSMHSLLISQTKTIELKHQVLQIDLDANGSDFRFQYLDRRFSKPPFEEKSSIENGFHTFQRFLEGYKWFLESLQQLELQSTTDPFSEMVEHLARWIPVIEEEIIVRLIKQLEFCIDSTDHPLFGKTVIPRYLDSKNHGKNVLFQIIEPDGFARVHLTNRKETNPLWPSTTRFSKLIDWIRFEIDDVAYLFEPDESEGSI